MKKNLSRFLCMLLAIISVMMALPLSVSAATCTHNYVKVYTAENSSMHSYVSKCTKCSTTTTGWGYSGWLDHTFNSAGKCTACGYTKVCAHSSTKTVYQYENDSMHSYYAVCNSCGKQITGYGYSGWQDHTFNGNTCSKCGFTKVCTHANSRTSYSNYSSTQHKVCYICNSCGISFGTQTLSHTWTSGAWSSISETQHSRIKTCVCGATKSETTAHNFSGNVCLGCGYRKADPPVVNASVTLSASGASGTLGSAGGEIAAESYPASYTVYASATNCSVTKIVYDLGGVSRTAYGSSVTITASSEKDFQTSTFTVYTSVSGVTATFTVNHKYVKKNTAYIMWETSSEATIRSISGNGLSKSLAYTMTIPNSYDSQGNLTADQIAAIQSLIGRSDGKTYTVSYTRTIWVYTPAAYSTTGQKTYHGSYDGNSSSAISSCLSAWGWSASTKEAIRQAASSSLSFTTSLPVNCTAVWVDSSTGKQLYSTTFGSGSVTVSQSTVVSIAYSAYSGSGSYVYESLAYSGDSTGTSTAQSYSQTYKATSKPLTVTFYCHPKATSGSITVRAVDGDTDVLISAATVKCGTKTGTGNPSTFTNCPFGTYSLSASADGYSSAVGTAVISESTPNQTVTLKLYKQVGDITVTVRDSATRAVIPNASVSGAGKIGTADIYGTVKFIGIAFGTYTFTASAFGYSANSGTATISKTGSSTAITIYLDPIPKTGGVTVTVMDAATHRPIIGASVSSAGRNGTTNSSGAVSFSDILYGSYTFSASATGYYSGSGTATISQNNPSASLIIYLTPIPTSGTISVTVRDANTNAVISDASVSGVGRSATTDSSGTKVFYDVPFGSYSFSAGKSGYYSASATASISAYSQNASVTIYLGSIPTSGSISVYVKDKESGAAIAGAAVSSGSYSAATNSSGGVSFSNMPFRSYTFTASADGYGFGSGSAAISEDYTSASVMIYLEKIKTDVAVVGEVNGIIYKGSTIMVSATVSNTGSLDFTPNNPLTVTMTAKRNGSVAFDTQSVTAICPKNDENLVWFTVDIPESGYSSNQLYFTFTITPPSGVSESNTVNNNATITATANTLPNRNAPDASLELNPPSDFTNNPYTGSSAPSLSWSVYEWNNGFVKKNYTAKLSLTAELVPDITAGYRKQNGSIWTTRSGYGLNTSLGVSVDTTSSGMTAGTLKADVFYPEYNYGNTENKSDRLELVGGKYVFKVNSGSVSGSRFHATPLWFPDGAYSVKYYAYDLWCPAGMLSGYTNAKVMIDGDMYDDVFTN